MKLIWPTLILFLGLITAAFSEELSVEREIKGKSGQNIRIAIFTNVLPDCTSGPLPTIRLVRPPEHGKLIVRKVRLSATNIKQCLALEVPALIAFYRSAADFAGGDSAILEIKSTQGAGQLQRYSITVSQAGPGQKI
jgi:hypothetical protein